MRVKFKIVQLKYISQTPGDWEIDYCGVFLEFYLLCDQFYKSVRRPLFCTNALFVDRKLKSFPFLYLHFLFLFFLLCIMRITAPIDSWSCATIHVSDLSDPLNHIICFFPLGIHIFLNALKWMNTMVYMNVDQSIYRSHSSSPQVS